MSPVTYRLGLLGKILTLYVRVSVRYYDVHKVKSKKSLKGSYAAAKSLQSCPTLCDPIDGSLPGSAVPGILQARTLEWVKGHILTEKKKKPPPISIHLSQPQAHHSNSEILNSLCLYSKITQRSRLLVPSTLFLNLSFLNSL